MITELFSLEPVAWLIRGGLLSCGVLMAGLALRHRSAIGRALLWRGALAGLILLVPVVLAGWRLSPFEGRAEASGDALAPALESGDALIQDTWALPAPTSPRASVSDTLVATSMPTDAADSSTTPPVSRVDGRGWAPVVWAPVVWAVWVLGAMGVVVRWGVALWRRRRLAAESTPVAQDSEWVALTREVAGPKGRVRLLRSSKTTVPCAWGMRRPTILLPSVADAWSLDHRRMALAHEWEHLQRRDPLWLVIATVALALHWANPLAWMLVRRWRLAEEEVADDAAVGQAEPRQYASLLVACARSISDGAPTPDGVASMAHPSTVPQRVRRILDQHRPRQPASRLEKLFALLSCALALTGVVAVTPQLTAQERRTPAAPADVPPADPAASPADSPTTDPAQPAAPLPIKEKLRSIVIPTVVLEQATLEESVEFLRLKSRELDTFTNDPNQRGVNFILRLGQGRQPTVASLNLTNVPLDVAVRAVCDQAGVSCRVEPFAVIISEKTGDDAELYTKVFRVPPDFLNLAGGTDAGTKSTALHVLNQAGIQFPEGGSAFFSSATSTLTVRHTPAGLDLIEQFVESFLPQSPKVINLRAEIYRLPKAQALAVAESLDTKLDATEAIKTLRAQAGKPNGAILVAAPSMQTRSGQRARVGSGMREPGRRTGRNAASADVSGSGDNGSTPPVGTTAAGSATPPEAAKAIPGSDGCLFEAEATLGGDGHTLDVSTTVTLGTPASGAADEGAAGTSSLTSSTTLYAGQTRLVGTLSGGGDGNSMLLVFLKAAVATTR